MVAHARLKNEYKEDDKGQSLMIWLILCILSSPVSTVRIDNYYVAVDYLMFIITASIEI